MSTSTIGSDAVQWSTGQVLDWMANFTDSKEGIRVKIMSIVQENDLDGHALKQLRDDPDELHDLLPILKERLTFRAMMRNLYGPNSSTRQTSTHVGPDQRGAFASARESPTQLPSTSLDSPPPPPPTHLQMSQLASPLTETESGTNSTGAAVLPAFSSFPPSPVFKSSGPPQQVGVADPANHAPASTIHHRVTDSCATGERGDAYRVVYPTGIISDRDRQNVTASPTSSQYCGQAQPVGSASMTTSSDDYQFTYRDVPLASTSEPSTQSQLFNSPLTQRQTASTAAAGVNDYRRTIGTWNVRPTGLKYTKAHLIAQKYRKILQRVKKSSSNTEQEHIPFPAPLPTFSPILRHQIEIGNILSFKTRFVYECAQFYMSIDPTPTHAAYRNISMTIIAKFPQLADQNNVKEPWRPFNTSLSQAIRNIRRRLRSVPGTGFPPVEPRYQHVHGKRFTTPNHSNARNRPSRNQAQSEPSNVEDNDVTIVSTNETSEPVLIEDDDPLETVDLLDERTVETEEEAGSGEKNEIVIKMEDLPSKEEDDIPTEWSSEKT